MENINKKKIDETFEQELQQLIENCEKNNYSQVDKLSKKHPAEIAHFISSLPPSYRYAVWLRLKSDKEGGILKELSKDVKRQLIERSDVSSLSRAAQFLQTDDLADIIPQLPDDVLDSLLLSMDEERRSHLRKVLSYPEDTAGGLMNTDVITVRRSVTVDTVLRYLRLLKKVPNDTDKLFIVERSYKYVGSVYVSKLLISEPSDTIDSIKFDNDDFVIKTDMLSEDIVELFKQRNLISAPVVDNNNILVGRITIDDVVDVFHEQAEHCVMSMAGLDEKEDIFTPVMEGAKNRIIWLAVNFITALFSVFFIAMFADTIEKKISLAILMPIVASMGGVAGSQSLILLTRAIALKKINKSNFKWVFKKEFSIGVVNGIIWAIIIAIITQLWFDDTIISIVIGLAIIINLIVAAIFGAYLPSVLEKFNIDPALAGGVILTTVTDVVGFVSFLGLANLILL